MRLFGTTMEIHSFALRQGMLLLLTILLSVNATGQKQGQARIDSIISAAGNMKEDSAKVKLLARVATMCESINPEQGIKVGAQALELAEKIKWKKGIATACNSLAANYRTKGDNAKVLEYLFRALKINEESGDKMGETSALNNIGLIYEDQKNFPKALEYFTRALDIQQKTGNKTAAIFPLGNLASVYYEMKDYASALRYDEQALALARETGDKSGEATYLEIIGDVYRAVNKKKDALAHYAQAMAIIEQTDDSSGLAVCKGFIGDLYLSMAKDTINYTSDSLIPAGKGLMLKKAIVHLSNALALSKRLGFREGVSDFSEHLSEALEASGDYKGAISYYQDYIAMKDSIFNIENNVKITNLETKRELELKDKQIQIEKLDVAKKRNERGFFIAGMVALLIIIGVVFRNYRTQKLNNKLLSAEKEKSEDLLLNILPSEVATELKEKGKADARYFDNVTVLFTDFVNFTKVGEQMSPKELVDELHNCFEQFDNILSRYNIEKIKTVGDAYLAVAGLPTAEPQHAYQTVLAALEMARFMEDRYAVLKDRTFRVRVGVHSGSVVAGIVGSKKFAYDVWGDTVNTAARMEQNSSPGKVNISGATYELVKDKFRCTYRGEIEAKGKGQMKMYFVDM